MFYEFFRFEFFKRFKQPMIYIFFALNFLLVFFGLTNDNIQIGGTLPNVNLNSPYVIQNMSLIMTLIGLLMTTAFINTAALRDFENNFDGLLFSKPISKFGYLFGRYVAAVLAACVPLLGVLLACWVAGWETFADGKSGAFYGGAYLQAFLVFILPNTILAGAFVFMLAALFRSSMVSFIGAIALLIGYSISGDLVSDLDNESTAALLDPFGVRPFFLETKYWTIDDKNTLYLSLSNPTILINRLIWFIASLGLLALTYVRFSFTKKTKKTSKKSAAAVTGVATPLSSLINPEPLPIFKGATGTSVALSQLWGQTKTEFKGLVTSTPFIVIALFGLLNMVSGVTTVDESYGTGNYPVTYLMVQAIEGTLFIFLIAIIMYYSGVIVWRERDAKMNEFYDASPFPNWVPLLSKYLGLVGVIAVVLFISILVGVTVQTFKGYTNYEFTIYFVELMVLGLGFFAMLAALSMAFQVLINNKYVAYFAFIVFLVLDSYIWGALNINSNLVSFGSTPNYTYSDLNGFLPYISGQVWFNTYWLLFSGLVLIAGIVFWVRGRGYTFGDRVQLAKRRLAGGTRNWAFGLGALFLLTSGWLYYNTQILNSNPSRETREEKQYDYEVKYRHLMDSPQPKVTDVDYQIDIYPEERRFEATVEQWVKNKSAVAIDTIYFSLPQDFKVAIELPCSEVGFNDSLLYFKALLLCSPLQPGDSLKMNITSTYEPKGIENELGNESVIQNGTFVNNGSFMPTMGYNQSYEIGGRDDRKARNLPERERMPKLTEPCGAACDVTYISQDADWVNMTATMSTSLDQIAIAPGSLIKEWEENGRRYFQYKLDKPVLNFYSFISGRYEVVREKWNDVDLEVYYHPGHEMNVDKMIKSMRKSLEYYSDNFLPYPHNEARIIEFPRYASFAQAFPGTMPYSESIGFIANLKEEGAIDMVYYVVAHEMAHQWWAHQVIGAAVQGATMLSETFSQYGALMVMQQEYGKDKMQQFLKYELDRYLRGRGGERRAENPLIYNENQSYIHYRKGSVVMYALQDYISEDSINSAMQRFAEAVAYQEPPYTNTLEFMPYLEAVTPDSLQYLLTDWFRDIILYDNRTIEATAKELPDGQFEVTFTTSSTKYRADSTGRQTEIELNGEYIDVAIYREAAEGQEYGTPIYRERKLFTQPGEQTFTVTVDEKPYEAGLDPRYLLIDRLTADNMKKITFD